MYCGNNPVHIDKDTSISGNLDVGGVMDTTKMKLTNDDTISFPLVITNNGGNWFQGECIANANNVGCLFRYRTSGSSTYWWSGVWGSNTNDFNIWFNYKGLSIKSNGSAAKSCNLDVGTTGDNQIKIHGTGVVHMLYLKPIMVIILIGVSKMAIILKHGLIYQ